MPIRDREDSYYEEKEQKTFSPSKRLNQNNRLDPNFDSDSQNKKDSVG